MFADYNNYADKVKKFTTIHSSNSSMKMWEKYTLYCQRYVKVDAYNTYVRPILAFVWSQSTYCQQY